MSEQWNRGAESDMDNACADPVEEVSVLDELKNIEVAEAPQPELVAAAEELKAVPPPQFDPVASASQIFETFFPIYCKQLDKLSSKQIRRLAKAAIGLPLEEGFKPNLKDEKELNAYFVLERLMQAKMVLMHSVLTEKQREQEAKTKAQLEAQAKAEETQGDKV